MYMSYVHFVFDQTGHQVSGLVAPVGLQTNRNAQQQFGWGSDLQVHLRFRRLWCHSLKNNL